jgi:hypothetical protein
MPPLSKRVRLTLCCGPLLLLSAARAEASPESDTAALQQVMADYHAAVVSHDGARLARLFAPTGSAWFNALSDPSYALLQAKTPGIQKVRSSSVESFASFVSTSKAKLDPEHGTVRIQTDGTIASAYFDYRFVLDGKVQNQGSESWLLVKFADGWRIASIVYSSNPPGQ